MTETQIDQLLDEHVAPFGPGPDGWADVLSRARRTRRHYLLMAATVAALLIVPAAFALRGEITNLFQGTPAPSAVSTSFESGNRIADMATQKGFGDKFPHADVSRAHGVIEIQTPDGPEELWAAPNEQGGNCWWIDFANDPPVNGSEPGFGSCDTVENMHTNTIATGLTWEEPHAALMTLFGRVDVQADRVVVQLADGSTRTLPVVEGAFLASVDKGARLAQVTAYDGDEQVATWEAPVG